MSRTKYLIALIGMASSTLAYGQDLASRVPEEASLVAVINNSAIVKHSSFEKLNALLNKLGAFDAINSKQTTQFSKAEDFDLAYDRNAYVYKTDTDSSTYVGILIPLKAGHQIEQNVFSDFTARSLPNGYKQATAPNGKTQIAWNDNSLLIFTGDYKSSYFQNDSIAALYGIENVAYNTWADDAAYSADTVSPVEDMAGDEDWAYADVDTLVAVDIISEPDTLLPPIEMMSVPAPPVDTAGTYWEDDQDDIDSAFTYADSVTLENDLYSEDSYQEDMARNAKNDSIRNAVFATWLARDFESYLAPAKHAASQKGLQQYDKNNTLIHIWVKDLDEVYQSAMPYDVLNMGFGINMKNLDYGYQDALVDLVQEKNVLKVKASVGLDKDVQGIFADMYKTKPNRKFAKYIPENHLGYLSLNINTEAYLNSLPTLFERWYGPMMPRYEDLISIAGLSLQVALDEKALSKVMKGDHLVFINDLKKMTTEYVDYEYDEDYNYKQVTKTKEEEIPNFLWMFTSEDQRIFKKLLAFAEKENKANVADGIYRIAENEKSMPIFITFKDDIVFIGNDEVQLGQIQKNAFKASKDAAIRKDIFGNTMIATVHTAQIPGVISKLGMPVVGELQETVKSLSEYGDITVKANGLRKKRIEGEFSVAFPNKESNALQYLMQYALDMLNNKSGM